MSTTDKSSTLVEFKVQDKGTPILGGISAAYEKFAQKMADAHKNVSGAFSSGNLVKKSGDALGRSITGGFGSITQGLNLGFGGSIGSAAIIGAIARNFANLESVMVDVSLAAKDITDGELKELKDQIVAVGAEFPATSTEVAKAVAILAREKFNVSEIKDSMRSVVLADLASQTNNTELTTKALVAIQRANNLSTDKMNQTIDRTLATQSFFGTSAALPQLGDAYRRVGSSLLEFGVSQEESLALIGNLLKKGMEPDTAATTIEAILRDIKTKAMPAIEKDKKLRTAFLGSDGKFNSILEFLDEFNRRNLDPYKLFGDEARRGVTKTKQGRDDIQTFMTQTIGLNDQGVDRSAGFAENVQAKVSKTFKYQLNALIGDLEVLGDKLAESGLMDILRDAVKDIGKVIEEISQWPKEQKELLVKGLLFGAISGPLVNFAKGLATLGSMVPPAIVLGSLWKLVKGIWRISQWIMELPVIGSAFKSYGNFMEENVPSVFDMWDKVFPENNMPEMNQTAVDSFFKSLQPQTQDQSKGQASLMVEFLNAPEMNVRGENLDKLFPNVKLGFAIP